MKAATLSSAFLETVKQFGDRESLLWKEDEIYRAIDYRELFRRVKNLALGLANLGIKKGDRVSIFSFNRPEWAISDLAIICLGAVNVPLYPTLSETQLKFIINDAGVKAVLVSGKEQKEKIIHVKSEMRQKLDIINLDDEENERYRIKSLTELSREGEQFGTVHDDYFEKAVSEILPDDICAIVYTSGTTGEPKGVMLSHGNILSNVRGALTALNITHTDRFLSFLPLSHVFERMAGQFCPIVAGGSIAYAESPEKVVQNMAEAKPTITCTVPRLLEKMHAGILANVDSGPSLKRRLFYWGLKVGRRFKEKQREGKVDFSSKFQHALASKLVYKKIHQIVGGNLRYFISGGAPLSKQIGEFFDALNVNILEGYGLTETSPVISVNLLGKMKFGTVGPALKEGGVEVKIAPDGEILTRGPHVMLGYYKNPAATKEIIDEQGWLHTGDIGFLDEDGYLTITDRKKNIIIMSNGKNVAPAYVENKLLMSPLIDQIVVIGNGRKFLSALIVPNRENLLKAAFENGIREESVTRLLNDSRVKALMQAELEKFSTDLARFERIKEFRLLEKPFSIEDGELTPTLKVKRKVIEQKYIDLIEDIYQESN